MTTGTVIAGRYRLREAIGSGGMGQVWLAADDMLGRNVAVKEVTTPDLGQFATVPCASGRTAPGDRRR